MRRLFARPRVRVLAVAVAALLLVSAPWLWTVGAASGHVYGEAAAPAAEVAIVLGTEVMPDGTPSNRLAGRLRTAAALVHGNRARVLLVSGDGGGASGDEPAAMTAYLTSVLGVDSRRVVADPSGLDTYDSCLRARDVYGIRRALVVTQWYHVRRAVTLCRHVGLDVDGVVARCDGCGTRLVAGKAARDYAASGKAALDAVRDRPPAVSSPASTAVHDALTSHR